MINIDLMIKHPKNNRAFIWYHRGEIKVIENQMSLVDKSLDLSDVIDLFIMLGFDYESFSRPVVKGIFNEIELFLKEKESYTFVTK